MVDVKGLVVGYFNAGLGASIEISIRASFGPVFGPTLALWQGRATATPLGKQGGNLADI